VSIAIALIPIRGSTLLRTQAFARGSDNQIYHKFQVDVAADAWTNWAKIPTPNPNNSLAADPAVGVNLDGTIDLFIRYTTDLDLFQVFTKVRYFLV
jgi:hypothetical protein